MNRPIVSSLVLVALTAGFRFAVGGEPVLLEPNLDDNTREFVCAEGQTPTVTDTEKAVIRRTGGEPDLRDYLSKHPACQAALRVFFGWNVQLGVPVATLFIEADAVRFEYLGYHRRPEALAKLKRLLEGSNALAIEGMDDVWVVWKGSVGSEERYWIASEFHKLDALLLPSCSEKEYTPRPQIPILRRPDGFRMNPQSALSSPRFFVAIRTSNGTIEEHSFSVKHPEKLADVRYERLCYVFRRCEPMANRLARMAEPYAFRFSVVEPGKPYLDPEAPLAPDHTEWLPEEALRSALRQTERHGRAVPTWVLMALPLGGLVFGWCLCLGFLAGLRSWRERRAGGNHAADG